MKGLFVKLSLVVFIGVCSLFAQDNKEKFYNDMQKEFKHDFGIWGVQFTQNNLMIRFSRNNLLYLRGQAEVQDSFKLILKDFYPRFIPILMKYRDEIESVEIKGHTSSENRLGKTKEEKYQRNKTLSQKRADYILKFIKTLSDDVVIQNFPWVDTHFKSIGVSSSEPIYDENGNEDKELSRRTEIVINFRKQEIQEEVVEEEVVEKKFFTLEHYVKRLLVENPDLNEQYYLLQSLKYSIEQAKSKFRPTVDLNLKHTQYEEDTAENKEDALSKDITLSYNLFNGFKDEDEIKINEYKYNSSVFAKEQVENELIYSISEAYIMLQKANDVFELSRANYEDYIQWEEKAQIKFQNGLLSLKDFSKIQARSLNRYMNFEEDTKRYIDGITTMQKFIDFNDKELEFFKEPIPYSKYFDNLTLAIEDGKVLSPHVKEAEQNIILYKTKLDKTSDSFYPTVDLIAKKSIIDEDFETASSTKEEETSIAISAKFNLYNGGADDADQQIKLHEYRQKLHKKDSVIRDVVFKIDLALNKLNLLTIKEDFLKDLVEKREEEYVAANYDFKFAKIDENALLDIVDSLYNARRQFLENKYDLLVAKYKLLQEIGTIKTNILEGE